MRAERSENASLAAIKSISSAAPETRSSSQRRRFAMAAASFVLASAQIGMARGRKTAM
jgi:hypothetical protein